MKTRELPPVLERPIVLELTKYNEVHSSRTPGECFMLFTKGAVQAVGIRLNESGHPVFDGTFTLAQWLDREPEPGALFLQTPRRKIAIPQVIVSRNTKVPRISISLDLRGVYIRDRGIDQYTGLPVDYEDASIDHIIPACRFASRADATYWENVALCHKDTNMLKDDMTPEEAGMKLIREPKAPKAKLPVAVFQHHKSADMPGWKMAMGWNRHMVEC